MVSTFPHIVASPLAGCLTELLLEPDSGRAAAQFLCPADFAGFAGHFPGQPVVPAVMQLLAVRLLAEALIGSALLPVGVERLKFKGMIGPEEQVQLQVSVRAEGGRQRAEFRLDRSGALVATGALLFRQSAGEG